MPPPKDESTNGRLSGGLRRRFTWRWLVAILVVLVVYGGVLLAFAIDDTRSRAQPTQKAPKGGVLVAVEPTNLDTVAQTLTARITITPDDALLGDDLTPKKSISIDIYESVDEQPVRLSPGSTTQVAQVRVFAYGNVQDWPFDRYRGSVTAFASTGSGLSTDFLPTHVEIFGQLQSWHVHATTIKDKKSDDTSVTFVFRRTLGVTLVGLSLVLVLIMLPTLGLFVAVNVYRGRRKVEPAFASWIAAMLFATVPLRNFLPGSPPPGSWIDVAVVLWVIVGLIVALMFWTIAWWQSARRPPS